jgi:hypothetical protein
MPCGVRRLMHPKFIIVQRQAQFRFDSSLVLDYNTLVNKFWMYRNNREDE